MTITNNRLFALATIVSIINILSTSHVSPMLNAAAGGALQGAANHFHQNNIAPQQPIPQPNAQTAQEYLNTARQTVNHMVQQAGENTHRINASMLMAYITNDRAIRAHQTSTRALEESTQALNQSREAVEQTGEIRRLHTEVQQLTQTAATNLTNEFDRLREAFAQEVVRNEQVRADTARIQNDLDRETRIQVETAIINERQRLGLYEQEERIRAQAAVDGERVKAQATIDTEITKWNKIQQMIDDPKRIAKIVLAFTTIALGIYAAKYGIPMLIDYLKQPRVISETSKTGWFGWSNPDQVSGLDSLIFAPSLRKQLFDLALRIESAKMYNENLPNILFYGAPGTGKTAFAKELAYCSGLDYAITSGSEFAKITDLNLANNELRKLLNWAKDSEKGLIIFIDEAESLFANRKLPTTPKKVQDFINTFLALIPEKSQKNLMFIFATNHPFKLDDAITDRIGMNIEFTLPEKTEREKILTTYLEKFAQENIEVVVDLLPETMKELSTYADNLDGICPRAIKFIAQEMIALARRQENKQLTHEIAQVALDNAIRSLQQTEQWKKERNEWIESLKSVAVAA